MLALEFPIYSYLDVTWSMNWVDRRLLEEDNSRTVETQLITEPGEQGVINGNRQKDGSPRNTFIRGGSFLLQPKSTLFSSSERVCTETNISQSSPGLGVSIWALQRMWHIKRTSQHQTFQKNTAQLGSALLLVIHHSYNTSDREMGWSCTDAHYEHVLFEKRRPSRCLQFVHSFDGHCYMYRHTFVLSVWNKFMLFRNIQSHTFV